MNRRHFTAAAGFGAANQASTPALFAAQARAQAGPLHLKITELKTFVVNVGITNWVFCKLYTNQGITGLGEGEVGSKEATVAQAIMEHERSLLGEDPTNLELLWQRMFRRPRWRGGPILNSAISAVEIALWDILGQALGAPIYKLLGGAARERIRINKDVGLNVDSFQQAKAEGYTAAKSGIMGSSAVKNNLVIPSFAEAGYAELPDRSGLGVDLNEKVAAQHPYRPADGPSYVFSDGGVADR